MLVRLPCDLVIGRIYFQWWREPWLINEFLTGATRPGCNLHTACVDSANYTVRWRKENATVYNTLP
jgi:hypothetical protein